MLLCLTVVRVYRQFLATLIMIIVNLVQLINGWRAYQKAESLQKYIAPLSGKGGIPEFHQTGPFIIDSGSTI